jgi:predicted permease
MGDKHERELDEELRFHLEKQIELNLAAGMSPAEARRAAFRDFGGLESVKDECRDARPLRWLGHFARDMRYGLRSLRRNAGFAVVAVLTLALGIGANTAIFSILHGVLLAPLPYPDPDRLVRVFMTAPEVPRFPLSPLDYLDYRRECRSFDALALYTRVNLQLGSDNRPEQLSALRVSHNYFDALGWRPARGRTFEERETRGGHRVVVLSDRLWRRRFSASPGIVGRSVRLDGLSWTVIGVMPPGMQHVGGDFRTTAHGDTVDLWWPFDFQAAAKHRTQHYVNAIGRLRAGVTLEQAAADLKRVSGELARRYPDTNASWTAWLLPLEADIVGATGRPIRVLMTAVGFVLLIACVNIANLMLARAGTRYREIALRAALGAGRGALARLVLAESLLIALAGGAAGTLLASFGVDLLRATVPADFPRLHMVGLHGPVLAFSAAVTLLTALAFGALPALHGARVSCSDALREGRHATSGRALIRLRGWLVLGQVTLATALLFAAGLLLRSFKTLLEADHGFDPRGVLTFSLSLPDTTYQRADVQRFHSALLERIRALPRVRVAGAITAPPWTGWHENTGFEVLGCKPSGGRDPNARFNAATPGAFRALGIPLKRGRDFNTFDTGKEPTVVLVNEALARAYLSGGDPVGRKLKIWGFTLEVVGVVADVKDAPADAAAVPAFYWSAAQVPYRTMSMVVRSDRSPLSLVPAVRRELAALDPELPIAEVRALETIADAAFAARRFLLLLVGIFGSLAAALAAVGIYGVLSYAVVQRRRELAIRMTFGAGRSTLVWSVFRQGIALAAAGLGAGLVLAVSLGRLLTSFLYGISPADGWTLALVSAGIAAIAGAACLVPAWRATRVDPNAILRAA